MQSMVNYIPIEQGTHCKFGELKENIVLSVLNLSINIHFKSENNDNIFQSY
uniref:Uncharacterized protein n=1 Tax=Anguilla anguilla TaxID=7936 RepID=A0A0E9VIB4_ANGAN